jgi:signal transduction histidine kinase
MHPIYDKLSRIGFLSRSYSFKFLFVAFLGIHVPLIGLIIFVLFASHLASVSTILLTTLLLTLGATAATLLILNGLLSPLRECQQTLKNYLHENAMPQLPLIYYDEAGQLMQHIQITITELNSVLEEKKDLTALLSHDLRIPLRNVQTFADLIQQRDVSVEEAKEIAAGISESVREQQQLLETILEILRMDYLFKDKTMLKPVLPDEIIEDVMLAMKMTADQKEITLTTDIQDRNKIEVHPELFKQVIKNLISNAIKFSHAGSEVKVIVRRDGIKTAIDVIDQGIGFTEEIGKKLFERFTSAGRKGTAGEQTTGLGLYLSRKIVRHQHGEIEAYSAGPNKGARFSVSFRK